MTMKILEDLRERRKLPHPSDLLDALERHLPLLGEMESTPQDSEWHAEGNVKNHTEMVISEACKIISSGDEELSSAEVVALVVGAALHDIGKPLVTREQDYDGKMRIVSPHHADRGRSYAAPYMGSLDLTNQEIQMILGLIRHHHDLKKLVLRPSTRPQFSRLARTIDLRMLYLLEICDHLGRICSDQKEQLDILELFRAEAESYQLWRCDDPYKEWKDNISDQIPNRSESKYVVGEAIRQYELGSINSPEEAIAKTWEHRTEYATVTMISAPSGSGKSSWINAANQNDVEVISLDEIRENLTGKRSDQSKNGQVMQLAKERLREAFRKKRDVFWDSTSLRQDGRSGVIGLAHDYHAASRIVALGVPKARALRQNQKRKDQIPGTILERQYRQWQWPDRWEAHEVEYIFEE